MPNYQIKLYDYSLGDADYCIGADRLNLMELNWQLEAAQGMPVDVHISSVGGSAFEAIGMYDALKKYPGGVTTYVDSLAASAASIVAMGGQKVVISKYALMMIHKPQVGSAGNADDLQSDINMLNIVQSRLAGIYMDKTKLSEDEINVLINATTWLTAEQALELGFVDQIEDYTGAEITNLAHMLKNIESSAPVYCKRVFNKITTIQNNLTMNTDKELIEKTTSVLEKITNWFKKQEIKTVTNKGTIKSYAPLNKGVAVTNEMDEDLEDGDLEVDNAGTKVVYNIKGGKVENITSSDVSNEDDGEPMDKAVLNSVGLKVTNKAEVKSVAAVITNQVNKINEQNALIADLSAQLKVSNELVARDETKIGADIKSKFTPTGSKRSDTTAVGNEAAVPKFLQDTMDANKQITNVVKSAKVK